ncbi:nucleoside deaminase [Herbiconiux moechotypicola]|uniref:Nucleoside deaminase n=1 Tax=Herbiconiux moechotypicola TaxID=637393 RepID=A0ABN3DZR3_9MICO|nr:nucleoside deaminase [Herbiconiux moechotypicola]MCS5731211.1 nucleoside deaminase [Herbiconiux moechotypicola]
MDADDERDARLTRAVELAAEARARGDHPFGALLVAPDGTVVEVLNSVLTDRDPTGHAETNLVRAAARRLEAGELAASVLYTSTEPCAMCSGAIYWAGIGTVVFALSSSALTAIVEEQSRAAGRGDEAEPTLELSSRELFARGGRTVTVVGPIEVPGGAEVHAGFWA